MEFGECMTVMMGVEDAKVYPIACNWSSLTGQQVRNDRAWEGALSTKLHLERTQPVWSLQSTGRVYSQLRTSGKKNLCTT